MENNDIEKMDIDALAELYPCKYGCIKKERDLIRNWENDPKLLDYLGAIQQHDSDDGDDCASGTPTAEEEEKARLILQVHVEREEREREEREKLFQDHPDNCTDKNCPVYFARMEALEKALFGNIEGDREFYRNMCIYMGAPPPATTEHQIAGEDGLTSQ